VNENLLSFPEIRSFDEGLPGSQADQGDRRRFCHRECLRLDRDVLFCNRDEFRERTDSPVSRPRIDFVAGFESPHS
jgi:hypothetical protein